MDHAEWLAEGQRRFGADPLAWLLVCPGCGHVASVGDYKAAGAPDTAVGFSCIGRYLPPDRPVRDWLGGSGPGPCNYAGGGLFGIHPVEVVTATGVQPVFAFADATRHGAAS